MEKNYPGFRNRGRNENLRIYRAKDSPGAGVLMAGWAKLSGNPMMVQVFAAVGVGQWFRYATGGIEVAAAIGLLPAFTAGPCALLLVCTMFGATLAHRLILGGSPAAPLVLGALSAAVAFERFQDWKQNL